MTNIVLKIARSVDYSQLEQLLAAGKWKEADQETGKVMLAVAGRESEAWLRVEDIDNFPCEDLQTINQLWLHYSNGKFGFSVQKEIYESLCGISYHSSKERGKFGVFSSRKGGNSKDWEKFGDHVGWRKGGSWLYYSKLTFNNTAPKAHLPSWLFHCWVSPDLGGGPIWYNTGWGWRKSPPVDGPIVGFCWVEELELFLLWWLGCGKNESL